MAVNARTEEFQHIEVFDKPALFTNGRIARDTVPKGWYCYDIRGSDDDPGALCYMEKKCCGQPRRLGADAGKAGDTQVRTAGCAG
ncbi:MAG: LPD28 domain-containing protein [Oscillospiraceae bacterium]